MDRFQRVLVALLVLTTGCASAPRVQPSIDPDLLPSCDADKVAGQPEHRDSLVVWGLLDRDAEVRFVSETSPPALRDPRQLQRAMVELYPEQMQRNGTGGTVQLVALLDEGGVPLRVRVYRSSGHVELDLAGVNALQQMRFVPGSTAECRLKSTLHIPLHFPTLTISPRR